MPTEEDIEQMTTERIDREEVRKAILKFEIENLNKAVDQIENVSGLGKGKG